MNTINLTFSIQELNAILSVLGELPAKTGVWPLIVNIKQQAEMQITSEESANKG